MSRSDVDRLHRERVEADARYNRSLTALDRAIVATSGRPLTREDFDGLATALLVFLQQITGFVETSDRQIVSEIDARFARFELALANSAELRVQLNMMQRALQALRRESAGSSVVSQSVASRSVDSQSVDSRSAVGAPASVVSDTRYLAFEDEFRGSVESVEARVREY